MHPKNIELDKAMQCLINYTNYRGERKSYVVIPHSIQFGKNEFHPYPQWLMTATDVTRNVIRIFAMKDIHTWEPVK